ncbi:MAG: hypothetical protein K2I74_10475 [Treponemataceae bacterium]|nr:hypothetical protein [Treponemataceae bacterium]
MIQDEIIGMLKTALDKANAKDASSSDFDGAVLDLICLNRLAEKNVIQPNAIFSALETEIRTFLNSPLYIKRAGDVLPPSDKQGVVEIHTKFLLTQLHTLPPLQLKIDFGCGDSPSQD